MFPGHNQQHSGFENNNIPAAKQQPQCQEQVTMKWRKDGVSIALAHGACTTTPTLGTLTATTLAAMVT
jgi:hypothetical protein